MVDAAHFKSLAMSLDGVEELPHFEKNSFRVGGKIFATHDEKKERACLLLSLVDQSVFAAFDKTIIYPVPNKWGQKGWTFIELPKVRKDMFRDALRSAYQHVRNSKTGGKKSK